MPEEGSGFTHVDADGRARMVDVGDKAKTRRVARARAVMVMKGETLAAIRDGSVAKGSVLGTARVAGIMAAKRTAELIPLCHPIELVSVSIDFTPRSATELEVGAEVQALDRTGAEMEAMTACTIAALTVYDMCKAVDRGMEITSTRLTYKSGGKSGEWTG